MKTDKRQAQNHKQCENLKKKEWNIYIYFFLFKEALEVVHMFSNKYFFFCLFIALLAT